MKNLLTYIVLTIIVSLNLFSFDTDTSEIINFHFQQTIVSQYKPDMLAKYSGLHSLITNDEYKISVTSTFFFGLRLLPKTELYFNPELTGGQGLSGAYGIAGFPNGEIFRVGDPKPEITIARIFLRHTISLSDSPDSIDDEANQISTIRSKSYLALTLGKFSILDIFDNNKYSHDPRSQFMNWSFMCDPSWDYPGNTKGYTWGIAVEMVKPGWAVRIAGAMLPTEANQSTFDTKIDKANALAFEFEKKYSIFEKEGTIRFLAYLNDARMGNYMEAVNLLTDSMDITKNRRYGRTKYGFGLNIEQDLDDNAGFFARLNWSDGNNETWMFTEIDHSLTCGVQFHGGLWSREKDRLGLAIAVNGISKDHRDYLAAGGYGFIIGDGKLNYGLESIFETYYSFFIHDADHFWFTPDYQFILNPAYNKDRGPVHVLGFRVHIEF
jgi:high affinity Mn2+ porin